MCRRTPWSSVVPGSTGYFLDVLATCSSIDPIPELEYCQLSIRGVFRDPDGPQHGEGRRSADGREGGDRGRRHPKISTMMTPSARDENTPWEGWRRKE
jgi:hypothetical protein